MPIAFTPQDVNVDETAGSQPNEITLATFLDTPYAYLLNLTSGGAGEDNNFSQVAYNSTFLTSVVSGGTTVSDLIFTHPTSSNDPTLIPFSTTVGFPTTLQDVDGRTIYLFLDSSAASNGNVLIGRIANDPTAAAAFAIVLDEAANHQSAGAYVVLYEAMKHLDPTNINDVLDLTNQLYVSAATTTSSLFSDFSDVPSGNTDYAIIGPDVGQPTGTNLLVTGQAPKGNVNGPVDDSTVNVSTQGLGSGSQAVGKNATLQIDFITGGAANTTGGEDEIAYTAHVENVTEAQFSLTQVNPTSELINLVVSGHDSNDANVQGAAFRDASSTNVNITQVQVFDASGVLIEDSDGTPNATGTNAVTATINAAGDAVVTNLQLDYTVKVFSTGMDQIRITNNDPSNNASFDVGEILFSSTTIGQDNVEVGSKVNIIDDAPSIAVAGALPVMEVDETNFLVDDTESLTALFNISGGSDTATSSLSLVATTGVSTGLVATGTNTAITLVQSSSTLVQGVDGSNNVIFEVSVTGSTLKLDQKLAIKHPTLDPNEPISIASGLADLLKLQGAVTDKDGDPSGPVSINIADKFTFRDDGPSIAQDISGGSVAFVTGQTVTDTFTSSTGNDLGDGVKIGSFTDVAGLTETLSADGKTLVYSNTTGDLFRLAVTNSGYTFTVLQTQQNTTQELDFGAVKSGGPKETLAVPTADGTETVNFDGLVITNDNDPRLAVNNPGAASDADDLNPDDLGFGVKGGQASQMNTNEGFVADLEGADEFSQFTFEMQAIGSTKSVDVTYWTVEDGQLSGPFTTTYNNLPSGNATTDVVINTPQGVDQIYVEFEFAQANQGVRVLNFTETTQQTFDPVTMSFNLTNTDRDTDTVTSNTFTITADPTLII